MKLGDAPAWLQDLVIDKALGFLEAEEEGKTVFIEVIDDGYAEIHVGEFCYGANRKEWIIV